jgi:hypothetical protein
MEKVLARSQATARQKGQTVLPLLPLGDVPVEHAETFRRRMGAGLEPRVERRVRLLHAHRHLLGHRFLISPVEARANRLGEALPQTPVE